MQVLSVAAVVAALCLTASAPGVRSWASDPSSELNAVSCPGSRLCVAVGGPGILVSRDGGMKWQVRPMPLLKVKGARFSELMSVSCSGHKRCMAVGEGGVVIATRNGGRRWVSRLPPPGPAYLATVTCPSGRECVGVGEIRRGRLPPVVTFTHDGGRTWLEKRPPGWIVQLAGLACVGKVACVASGDGKGRGAVLVTTSAGQRWRPRLLEAGTQFVPSVSCWARLRCVGLASEGIVISRREGGRWKYRRMFRNINTQDISCHRGGDCVVVGGGQTGRHGFVHGFAAYSRNGGRTWQGGRMHRNVGELLGVSCWTRFRCVAVGLGGPRDVRFGRQMAGEPG